jgi:hypothetical protein
VACLLALQGRTVIIDGSYKGPKITKDGVTVAKSVEFEDTAKNVGANLVKQVAEATNKVAGDGMDSGLWRNYCAGHLLPLELLVILNISSISPIPHLILMSTIVLIMMLCFVHNVCVIRTGKF